MKYYFTIVALFIYSMSLAQDGVSLSIEVSADTIYMENAFRIQYTVKNGQASGFQHPEFEHLQLLQGPSRSSQMSIINGARSSEESYTYYFKPNQTGSFEIPAFELEIDGQSYRSNSLEVTVVDNPDGLHQDPHTGQIEGRPVPREKSTKRKRFKI